METFLGDDVCMYECRINLSNKIRKFVSYISYLTKGFHILSYLIILLDTINIKILFNKSNSIITATVGSVKCGATQADLYISGWLSYFNRYVYIPIRRILYACAASHTGRAGRTAKGGIGGKNI